MHKKATDYAMAHPEQMIEVAMQKLGQQRKSIEIAVPERRTHLEDRRQVHQRAKAYSELMFEKKQIRQLPDMSKAITKQLHVAGRCAVSNEQVAAVAEAPTGAAQRRSAAAAGSSTDCARSPSAPAFLCC